MEAAIIIGGIIGAFVGHLINSASTTGPRWPGDNRPTSGPGCLITLGIYIVCTIIGVAAGASMI